jgi:hypothetical protein
MKRNSKIGMLLIIILIICAGALFDQRASANVGVPKILSYQGRLLDSNGNLLGGGGTAYCFRFSLFNASSGGSQVWPAATASIMTATVTNGVFNIGVGDTSAGGDALTYNFQDSDTAYLNVQVATKVDPVCTGGSEVFETLLPRERVVASGYAINSYSVDGFAAAINASGTEIPVLASDTLTLAGNTPEIDAVATNTLTLQGGTGTGAIQFFSASNFINNAGALTVASTVTGRMLQATATSSQFLFDGNGAVVGTLSWTPTASGTLTIPNFGTATDTVALLQFAQTLNNKTLNTSTLNSPAINSATINTSTLNTATLYSPTVFAGMSIIQNVAATGLILTQNATGTALSITDAPTSTQTSNTVSISNGTNVSGVALLVTNYGTGNAFQVNDSSSPVFFITGNGKTVVAPSTDTSTAFTLKNASQTITLFAADTIDNEIKIGRNGVAGSIPTLLGLDEKTDAGDPTGFPGAMYYSSSTGNFRCYQGTAWYNCVPTNMQWQSAFLASRWGYWAPLGITATAMTSVNLVAPTVTGTVTSTAQAEDYYVGWTSGATSGNVGGLTQAFTETEPRYTPRLATRIRTDTSIASRRIWVGLNSAAITGSDEAAGAGATVFVGLRYSTTAGDTTWQCGSGDGTTISYTNTGVAVTASTYYDIVLDMSTVGQLTCEVAANGGSYVSVTKSNNVPTNSSPLGITDAVTTLAATTTIHRVAYVYLGGRN